jgi:hypothetical protein
MTVETQLRERVEEHRARHVVIIGDHDAPVKSFYDRADRDYSYKGFLIRREPDYQLWQISFDGRQVTGLHGCYTKLDIAIQKINDFLYEEQKRKNELDGKTEGNKTEDSEALS